MLHVMEHAVQWYQGAAAGSLHTCQDIDYKSASGSASASYTEVAVTSHSQITGISKVRCSYSYLVIQK